MEPCKKQYECKSYIVSDICTEPCNYICFKEKTPNSGQSGLVPGYVDNRNKYTRDFEEHTPEQRIRWIISATEDDGATGNWLEYHLGLLLNLINKST